MSLTRPFPTDPRLTGVAIAFRNPAGIADLVLPRVRVGKHEFRYLEFEKAERMTIPETLVGRKSVPNEVEFGATEKPGTVYDYGLDDVVPNDDVTEAAGTGYDPIAEATEGLTDLILLDREVRVANLIMDQATWATGHTAPVATNWIAGTVGSDPVADILTQMEAQFVTPNTMVLPQAVWNQLRIHPKVIGAAMPNAQNPGFVSLEQFKNIFELDNVHIGKGWVNTAKKGQTPNIERVWTGESVALFYLNPQATPRRGLTFGYTAEFGGRVAGQMAEPKNGLRGSVRVRVGESVNEIITCNDLGYLFRNTLT